jgi:hypothetical protein
MGFYDNLAKTAEALLASKGQTVIVERETGGTFDPAAGEETGATTEQQSVKAAVLIARGGKIQALDEAFGGTTQAVESHRFALVSALKIDGSALDFEPAPDHKLIEASSKEWYITGVTPINPAGTPVLYKCALRTT